MTTPAAPDLAAHPDAIPAESGRFFYLECDPAATADAPRCLITPVVAWVGVAPPAFPLTRALDDAGRLLTADPLPESGDDPVSSLFVDASKPLPGPAPGWPWIYENARPDADGSPRRDWSGLVGMVCPPTPRVRLMARFVTRPDGWGEMVFGLPDGSVQGQNS